jgi:hypothetical protein
MVEPAHPETETAYYYPQPYWVGQEGQALKTLLLFFDDIAILLPRYMAGRQETADPVVAGPLTERGLLRVLEPETFVDQQMTEDLATVMVDLLTGGAFDDLEPQMGGYHELSQSRLGWDADIGLAKMLVEELKSRGLARRSEDGVSVPLHPVVRTTILVLLAQLARAAGTRRGLSLHPVTASLQPVDALMRTLSRSATPSAGHLVTLDIEPVAISLETVPLDEILDFRRQHGAEYRAYARDCRRFLIELGPLARDDRHSVLQLRREDLQDRAHALRRTAQRAWSLPQMAAFGLGLAGAAWELVGQHDPISAAIVAAASATAIATSGEATTADAYSYIHRVERTFAGR